MNEITARAFADELEKIANGDMIDYLRRKKRGHLTEAEKARAKQRSELAKEASELLKMAGLSDNLGRAAVKTKNFVSSRARWVGEDMGGIIRDAGRPIDSLKRAWNHPDNSMLNKGLLAVGTYQGARSAMSKEDPEGKGRSRVQRVGRLVGGTAAGLISLPHARGLGGLPAGIAAGMAGEAIGGGVGKVIDKARGYKAPLPPGENPNARVATAPY